MKSNVAVDPSATKKGSASKRDEAHPDTSSSPSSPSSPVPQPPPIHEMMGQRRHLKLKGVGDYTFGKTIGQGQFGKVKIATHSKTRRKVAVKIISKSKLTAETVKMAKREVKIMKMLRHPNIVRLYELIETPSHLFIIMEYASGGEVMDFIVAHGRLRERDACKFFAQTAFALQYCHSQHTVHRDIKAENLLLDNKMNIKLSDFGLSNVYTPGSKLSTFCGSPTYASPELVQRHEYMGPEVDCWSMGVLLYFLVCGQLPFNGKSMPELFQEIITASYTIPDYVSPQCQDLIRSMLVVDPRRRANIDQILAHPWVTSRGYAQPATLAPVLPPAVLDPDVVKEMERMGYAEADIANSVSNDRYDAAAATYYLLCVNAEDKRKAEQKKKRKMEKAAAAASKSKFTKSLEWPGLLVLKGTAGSSGLSQKAQQHQEHRLQEQKLDFSSDGDEQQQQQQHQQELQQQQELQSQSQQHEQQEEQQVSGEALTKHAGSGEGQGQSHHKKQRSFATPTKSTPHSAEAVPISQEQSQEQPAQIQPLTKEYLEKLDLQDEIVQIEESKESKEIKEIKESKEPKEPKEYKEYKEPKNEGTEQKSGPTQPVKKSKSKKSSDTDKKKKGKSKGTSTTDGTTAAAAAAISSSSTSNTAILTSDEKEKEKEKGTATTSASPPAASQSPQQSSAPSSSSSSQDDSDSSDSRKEKKSLIGGSKKKKKRSSKKHREEAEKAKKEEELAKRHAEEERKRKEKEAKERRRAEEKEEKRRAHGSLESKISYAQCRRKSKDSITSLPTAAAAFFVHPGVAGGKEETQRKYKQQQQSGSGTACKSQGHPQTSFQAMGHGAISLSISYESTSARSYNSTASSSTSNSSIDPKSEVPRTKRFAFNTKMTSSKSARDLADGIKMVLSARDPPIGYEEVSMYLLKCHDAQTGVKFEIEICRLPHLPLNGIKFHKISGESWNYRNVCKYIQDNFTLDDEMH